MKKIQQGFTLIELMIVVAIIGILAAIALPAYQDYTIRAQVSEAMVLASGSKTAVAEYYNQTGQYPSTNTSAGVAGATDIQGNYVDQVTITSGLITAQMGNDANTKVSGDDLVLSALTDGGSVIWTCKSANIENQYLPTSCR